MIFIAIVGVISGMASAVPASAASFREAGIYRYDGVTQLSCGAFASGSSSCAAGRDPSPFYNLERQLTDGYDNYTSVFKRFGRLEGGVPGLDF